MFLVNSMKMRLAGCGGRTLWIVGAILAVATSLPAETPENGPAGEAAREVIAARFAQAYYPDEARRASPRFGIHGNPAASSERLRAEAADFGELSGLDRLRGAARSRNGAERTLAYLAMARLGTAEDRIPVFADLLMDDYGFLMGEAVDGISLMPWDEIRAVIEFIFENREAMYDPWGRILSLLPLGVVFGDPDFAEVLEGYLSVAPAGHQDMFHEGLRACISGIQVKMSVGDAAAVAQWEAESYAYWRAMRGIRLYRAPWMNYYAAAQKSWEAGDSFSVDFLRYHMEKSDLLAFFIVIGHGIEELRQEVVDRAEQGDGNAQRALAMPPFG